MELGEQLKIEWKKFGEGLVFNPKLAEELSKKDDERINLNVLKSSDTSYNFSTKIFGEKDVFARHYRDFSKIDFNKYSETIQKAVENLGFNYGIFSEEQLRAFMVMAELQQKSFGAEHSDLVIGNMSESVVQHMFINSNVDFSARSIMMHNSRIKQDVLDISILGEKEGKPYVKNTVGVRCHRDYKQKYLYSKHRIDDNFKEIADYIVFFNHFANIAYFITGIARKDFLKSYSADVKTSMVGFDIPEMVISDSSIYESLYAIAKRDNDKLTVEEFADNIKKQYSNLISLDTLVKEVGGALPKSVNVDFRKINNRTVIISGNTTNITSIKF